uniref:glutathione transferase n=1 Tax=Heterorhabditis bacteriophora TaxID=37862 RepID=A0A1I7XEN0_HETBA
MVHYKLTYFNGRGAAEISRQLFALAGQEYEDVRYERDEWPQHKDEMPFGQIPVLEVDGKKLAQSYAINRFLARQFGIYIYIYIVFVFCFLFTSCFFLHLNNSFIFYRDYQTEIRPVVLVFLGFQEGDLVEQIRLESRGRGEVRQKKEREIS